MFLVLKFSQHTRVGMTIQYAEFCVLADLGISLGTLGSSSTLGWVTYVT